ncbi:conserved hypothetical protein [Ricinus communis]|uniref:Uncharacterized protein n=1 Tax=Ricinus communis TaxID=3988 RepID=B9TCN5_RICCO|nr:conserved hypothetical protein [Ricinus communis]
MRCVGAVIERVCRFEYGARLADAHHERAGQHVDVFLDRHRVADQRTRIRFRRQFGHDEVEAASRQDRGEDAARKTRRLIDQYHLLVVAHQHYILRRAFLTQQPCDRGVKRIDQLGQDRRGRRRLRPFDLRDHRAAHARRVRQIVKRHAFHLALTAQLARKSRTRRMVDRGCGCGVSGVFACARSRCVGGIVRAVFPYDHGRCKLRVDVPRFYLKRHGALSLIGCSGHAFPYRRQFMRRAGAVAAVRSLDPDDSSQPIVSSRQANDDRISRSPIQTSRLTNPVLADLATSTSRACCARSTVSSGAQRGIQHRRRQSFASADVNHLTRRAWFAGTRASYSGMHTVA